MPQLNGKEVSWGEYNAQPAAWNAPRNPDGTIRSGSAPAPSGGGGSAPAAPSADITAAMSASMISALSNSMNAAATGAYNQSTLTGFVMKPVFDKDGNWTFDYQVDASGQRIPTVASGLTQAQIEDMAARQALAEQLAAGVVKDPATGQWIQTPDRIRAELQVALNDAQIRAIDEEIALNREKLNLASSQFDRELAFKTQTQLDNLTVQREQLAQQAEQFQITASGYLPTGQSTLEREKLDFQRGQELANAVADPTRLVEGAALAQILGGAKGGTTTQPTTGLGNTNNQAAVAQGSVPAAFGGDLGAAVNATQNIVNQVSATNPNVAISPELNQVFAGGIAPAFGNPEGVQGGMQALNTIAPASGNFAKVLPAAFFSLSNAGQKQYASLAQANQPGLKPDDLVRQIRSQLPGTSNGIVPAAFASFGSR